MHFCLWGQAAGGQSWNESNTVFTLLGLHPPQLKFLPCRVLAPGSQVNGNSHKFFFTGCSLGLESSLPRSPSVKLFALSFKPQFSHHPLWEVFLDSLEWTILPSEQALYPTPISNVSSYCTMFWGILMAPGTLWAFQGWNIYCCFTGL